MTKLKFFLKSVVGISIFASVIFLSAGKINFIPGWVYYFLSIFGLLLNIFLIRNNEQLMEERSSLSANTKNWDKKILGLSVVLTLSAYIVAGLEAGRFSSTDFIGYRYIIAGSLLAVMGQIIFAVAKSQNNYFSSVARIQTDREHKVCDKGLYKVVRHPGYLGMIISWLGFPLIKENGIVTGFSLKGVGNVDAESFCLSFIRAQQLGKGCAFLRGRNIVFKHDGVSLDEADPACGVYGVSDGGEFCHEIVDDDERIQISQLLKLTGPYSDHKIFVKPEISWSKGFTVYIKKK